MEGSDKLRLLERAVNASTNSIVITDPNLPDDPLVYVNPAFEETTGFAAREALGRNCRFLQGEDSAQPALAELRSAVGKGRQCTVVLRNYRKDGTLFWNELSIYPVRDEGGHLTNFLGVQNDVTERVRAEEVLAEIRRAERRRIARDLHDIVLQDLSGALQSLRLTDLQATGSGTALDLGEELEALARATSGLRSAIYDLRHEGEQPLVKSIESLVGLNRQLMPGREVALSVEEGLPEGLSRRMSVELLRVVQEALANARRHSGAERVEVRLRGEGGETIVAEVWDDGRGFDPGSVWAGVGLSAMRERAAGLGGSIEIDGRPGTGTRVVLRVPVAGGSPAPPRL
jgi:PAS domain S-box-containing protein